MESKLAYEDGVVVSDRTVPSRTRATARIDRRQASHERETVTSVVIDLSLPIDAPALSETVMEQMRLAAEKFPAIFLTAREKRFEERLRHLSEAYAETDALDEAYLRIHERELQARQALIKDTEMLDAKAVHMEVDDECHRAANEELSYHFLVKTRRPATRNIVEIAAIGRWIV